MAHRRPHERPHQSLQTAATLQVLDECEQWAFARVEGDVVHEVEESRLGQFALIRDDAPPLVTPQSGEVRKALEMLATAKRPMVMAGTSVKWSMAFLRNKD